MLTEVLGMCALGSICLLLYIPNLSLPSMALNEWSVVFASCVILSVCSKSNLSDCWAYAHLAHSKLCRKPLNRKPKRQRTQRRRREPARRSTRMSGLARQYICSCWPHIVPILHWRLRTWQCWGSCDGSLSCVSAPPQTAASLHSNCRSWIRWTPISIEFCKTMPCTAIVQVSSPSECWSSAQ